jgi:hypothetical protein
MNYSLNDDLTPEQFEELRQSGSINSQATYADYLELRRERAERRREAEAAGWTGCEPPDLNEEDQAIFAHMRDAAQERNQQPETAAA